MSAEENKELIRRFFKILQQEVWPSGNVQPAAALLAPDWVYHDPSTPLRGHEGFQQLITMYRTAFPDGQFTIEDLVAEGDKVLTRFTARGTHTGELLGIPPSGKAVEFSVLSLVRIEAGKIAEEWERFDTANMLQQIGAMPAPRQAGA